MADKQFEYRITSEPDGVVPIKTIWFRSTNYSTQSPYGWRKFTTNFSYDENHLIAEVKKRWDMDDCEFISARPETIDTMFTHG
jgi:hypothetical protein